jgi:DNA-directed RNA polymerase subunit N (RpoN/RPB10)
MPSATGQNWEKYQKEFADDEREEKKITPLTDEYGLAHSCNRRIRLMCLQGHPSVEDVRSSTLCCGAEEAREGNQR